MSDNVQSAPERQTLGRFATAEELRALNILLLKKEVAVQNVKNSQFPPGTPPQTQSAFYKAGMELFSEAKFDEDQWWKTTIIKNNFQGIQVSIDTDTGEFYVTPQSEAPAPPEPPLPPPVVVE